MNKYISLLALPLALVMFTGCAEEDDAPFITTYPVLEMLGPAEEFIPAGTPYVDPGFTCTMGTEDFADQVDVETTLDFANPKPGYYTISYTATNPEGFSTSDTRVVVVFDQADPVNGFYTVAANSFRTALATGAKVDYGNTFEIYIYSNGDGTYCTDDFLGGWYCQRAGYGPNYAMWAQFKLAADGKMTLLDSYVPGWGDSADGINSGSFDASTGTITWSVEYAGSFDFNVTATKNND